MGERKNIGSVYDSQAAAYSEFSDDRFAWNYLERPAFDRYVSDLCTPETRVLDIGCGTGVVARHLITAGVRPENITGIDPSQGQIAQARLQTPGVRFLEGSAENFELPSRSVDLVITNTVLHHLDNQQLEEMLGRVYDVLSPNGSYFFVDVDPDHNAEGRDPQNLNKWTQVKTPWRTEVPFFNRDPRDLTNMLDRHGFDKVSGWVLPVDPEGVKDPSNYLKYNGRPSRMAARYTKATPLTRMIRLNDIRTPSLIETPEQRQQRKVVEGYFEAWNEGSVDKIAQLFTEDAVYDEKPGKREPLKGIEKIRQYWLDNPGSQRNRNLESRPLGYSTDSLPWWYFHADFDVRGEHVDVEGVIRFAVDLGSNKITNLTEYFNSRKTPLSA